MTPANKSIPCNQVNAKSLFASKTFWAAVFTGIAALEPLAVKDFKAHRITVDDAGGAVLVLCGVGATIVGRVNAQAQIFTPDGLPGPNKSDL